MRRASARHTSRRNHRRLLSSRGALTCAALQKLGWRSRGSRRPFCRVAANLGLQLDNVEEEIRPAGALVLQPLAAGVEIVETTVTGRRGAAWPQPER